MKTPRARIEKLTFSVEAEDPGVIVCLGGAAVVPCASAVEGFGAAVVCGWGAVDWGAAVVASTGGAGLPAPLSAKHLATKASLLQLALSQQHVIID